MDRRHKVLKDISDGVETINDSYDHIKEFKELLNEGCISAYGDEYSFGTELCCEYVSPKLTGSGRDELGHFEFPQKVWTIDRRLTVLTILVALLGVLVVIVFNN